MIKRYRRIAIIYGGSGKVYAAELDRRIRELSQGKRYPFSCNIVMESILTDDILNSVCDIIRRSDICIAILTADDICSDGGKQYRRLRQNVVFELGMALFYLGRDNCIILSDFDAHAEGVELPSDMNGLDINRFDAGTRDTVFDNVLRKVIAVGSSESSTVRRYDNLIERGEYRINYEELLSPANIDAAYSDNPLESILIDWELECASLPHFDEKLIYFFERIGFLPVFGSGAYVAHWFKIMKRQLSTYPDEDIDAVGDKRLLDTLSDVALSVIEYSELKMFNRREDLTERQFRKLLRDFRRSQTVLEAQPVLNPLIMLVFCDYLGLTYLKLFDKTQDLNDLKTAEEFFEKCDREYIGKVDGSLRIWEGFLVFNLARCEARRFRLTGDEEMKETIAADYERAVHCRRRWLRSTAFDISIRNALSYEYFQASLACIRVCEEFGMMTHSEANELLQERLEELEEYYNSEHNLEKLSQIRSEMTAFIQA